MYQIRPEAPCLQDSTGRGYHLKRPAQEPLPGGGRRNDAVEKLVELGRVNPAGKQRHYALLTGKDVNQVKSLRVAVFESLELVEEHHLVGRAIAENDGPATAGLGFEGR